MPDHPPRIPAELADLSVPLSDLNRYHRNPRTGDLTAIQESLTTNGQYRPIVVNKGTHTSRPNEILAGNHTFTAAQQLGWDTIAATWIDVDDEAAARIVLVDNRTNDLAGYDTVLLAEILAELPDYAGTGYDQESVDDLLDGIAIPSVLQAETAESEGERAKDEHLTWGYVQWGPTRVQITSEEVERLDGAHAAYYEKRGTDAGFVHYLLDPHAQEGQAVA